MVKLRIIDRFTLFIILFLTVNCSHGQSYIPLVDTNSTWDVTWNCYPPGPYPCYSDYYKYRISGDTILFDTPYKKLFRVHMDPSCSSVVTDSLLVGGLREETGNKKVFIYDLYSSSEYLLYDFTLEAGDTVPMTYNNFAYPELLVLSVDSVICSDGYRKRFTYIRETWPEIEVIEGIGASTGLTEPMEMFEYFSITRCYYFHDTMIYRNPEYSSCDLETDTCISLSITESNILSNDFLVCPNPASGDVKFKLVDPVWKLNGYKLVITDPSGKINYTGYFTSPEMTVHAREFTPGIHFYILYYNALKLSSGILMTE